MLIKQQVPNHLYVDKKGEELIYLGQASQLRLPDGYWGYPVAHIYLKVKDIKRRGLSLSSPVEDILESCLSRWKGYYFSTDTRPVIEDKGVAFPKLQSLYDNGEFVLEFPNPNCYFQLSFIDHR